MGKKSRHKWIKGLTDELMNSEIETSLKRIIHSANELMWLGETVGARYGVILMVANEIAGHAGYLKALTTEGILRKRKPHLEAELAAIRAEPTAVGGAA